MVEQLTLNQLVRGSSPRGATKADEECAGFGTRSFYDFPLEPHLQLAAIGRLAVPA